MKPKLTKNQKEAQAIVKDIEKKKARTPKTERNILNWSVPELRNYILHKTAGMKPRKKMKFAKGLMKRIKEKKKERKLNK